MEDEPPHVIPHSRPVLSEEAVQAAAAVMRSGQLAHGEVARRLEKRWCDETGMAAAAAVSSGTAALRLALLAIGVESGDDVVVPAYSCVALLNAPLSLGAQPVLADVVCDDWTLDAADVRRRITPRTRAVVAVDLFGQPAQMADLQTLGHPVVEDCAHGIGGRTTSGPFGGGSAVSISSFYATKMIGAGEGGIVAVHDAHAIERVREARDYGDRLPDGRHLNDKMTEVEAAVALEQLERLPETLLARAKLVQIYDQLLADAVPDKVVPPRASDGRIWYRYAVRMLDAEAATVCARMAQRGVRAEQPVWDLRRSPQWRSDLTASSEAFDRVVSLPLYPGLRPEEQERVVDTLREVLQ